MAQTCDFKNFLNQALRDKFVCGVFDNNLRQKLLNGYELTFEKACEIAINAEHSEASNKLMQPQHQFAVRPTKKFVSQNRPRVYKKIYKKIVGIVASHIPLKIVRP